MIFGGSPVEPEEIVQLLREKVTKDTVREHLKSLDPSYNGDPGKEDKGWKEVIFSTLKEGFVAKYGGQEVFTRPEKKEKEFMLDFVWLEQERGKTFRRAVLGVEVEWWKGRKELLRNFQKLLFFKAPLKLLVYSCSDGCSEKGRDVEREELRGCLKEFEQHVKGERYLLIEFYKENNDWKQKACLFCVDQDGDVPEVTFSPLNEDTGWSQPIGSSSLAPN